MNTLVDLKTNRDLQGSQPSVVEIEVIEGMPSSSLVRKMSMTRVDAPSGCR